MEHGDLTQVDNPAIVVILEGVLTTPKYKAQGVLRRQQLQSPAEWEWPTISLKNIFRYAYNNVPVDVTTFLGQEVADFAANWLDMYHVDVRSIESVDYETFCESIKWRLHDIRMIVDSDPIRILRYGQMGYQPKEGEF